MSKRQHDRRARSAEQAAGAATTTAGAVAATAAQRAGAAVTRAGTALEHHSRTSAPAVGAAVGTAVETALEAADSARQVAGRVGNTAAGAATEVVGAVSGIIEEPAVRGLAVLEALRGVPVSPPAARRRWPWALGAALAGAAAGAVVAALVRRIGGADAPGAQEPHELRAVVDVPERRPAPVTGTTGSTDSSTTAPVPAATLPPASGTATGSGSPTSPA